METCIFLFAKNKYIEIEACTHLIMTLYSPYGHTMSITTKGHKVYKMTKLGFKTIDKK